MPKATAKDHNVLELSLAVLLLIICALLCGNICVIQLAKVYNDNVCQRAAIAAAGAVIHNQDAQKILDAAQNCLKTCSIGGFFIEQPQFTKFKYESNAQGRALTVGTSTSVRPPALFLVADAQTRAEGKLTLVSNYTIQIPRILKSRDR